MAQSNMLRLTQHVRNTLEGEACPMSARVATARQPELVEIDAGERRTRLPLWGSDLADRELQVLKDALREHVNALAVDIGPRTPSIPDSLVRAANYIHIHSVFEDAGLKVREYDYQYYDQRVTNVLATAPATAKASAYYVVGAHYDTVQTTKPDRSRQTLARPAYTARHRTD